MPNPAKPEISDQVEHVSVAIVSKRGIPCAGADLLGIFIFPVP